MTLRPHRATCSITDLSKLCQSDIDLAAPQVLVRSCTASMVGGLTAPPLQAEEEAVASTSQGVIFVLENAKLETAKVGKVSLSLHCQL